jgi:hypothetical protein
MAALDPHLRGADRVREVFARVRAGDAVGVAELYAQDGTVVAGGGEVRGRGAIQAFYQRTIDTIHPQPRVEKVLEAAPHFVALVDVPNDKGHLRALDLFELGDDGIARLEIFARS